MAVSSSGSTSASTGLLEVVERPVDPVADQAVASSNPRSCSVAASSSPG